MLILDSKVTGYVSISAIVAIPVGIASSAVGIKIRAITAEIKKYKSVIKKKKKRDDKLVLLAKSNLCYEMKKNNKKILKLLWNILYKTMETYCVSCKTYTANEN